MAGVTTQTAHNIAVRYTEEIIEMKRKALTLADITPDRTILEMGRLAYSDVRDILDEDGQLLPASEWSDDAAAAISGVEVEMLTRGRGPNALPFEVRKIKRFDKNAALSLLARQQRLVGGEGEGVNELASALADRLNAAPTPQQLRGGPPPAVPLVEDVTPTSTTPATPATTDIDFSTISDEEMAS